MGEATAAAVDPPRVVDPETIGAGPVGAGIVPVATAVEEPLAAAEALTTGCGDGVEIGATGLGAGMAASGEGEGAGVPTGTTWVTGAGGGGGADS